MVKKAGTPEHWSNHKTVYMFGWLGVVNIIWWLVLIIAYAFNKNRGEEGLFNRKIICFFGTIFLGGLLAFVGLLIILFIVFLLSE